MPYQEDREAREHRAKLAQLNEKAIQARIETERKRVDTEREKLSLGREQQKLAREMYELNLADSEQAQSLSAALQGPANAMDAPGPGYGVISTPGTDQMSILIGDQGYSNFTPGQPGVGAWGGIKQTSGVGPEGQPLPEEFRVPGMMPDLATGPMPRMSEAGQSEGWGGLVNPSYNFDDVVSSLGALTEKGSPYEKKWRKEEVAKAEKKKEATLESIRELTMAKTKGLSRDEAKKIRDDAARIEQNKMKSDMIKEQMVFLNGEDPRMLTQLTEPTVFTQLPEERKQAVLAQIDNNMQQRQSLNRGMELLYEGGAAAGFDPSGFVADLENKETGFWEVNAGDKTFVVPEEQREKVKKDLLGLKSNDAVTAYFARGIRQWPEKDKNGRVLVHVTNPDGTTKTFSLTKGQQDRLRAQEKRLRSEGVTEEQIAGVRAAYAQEHGNKKEKDAAASHKAVVSAMKELGVNPYKPKVPQWLTGLALSGMGMGPNLGGALAKRAAPGVFPYLPAEEASELVGSKLPEGILPSLSFQNGIDRMRNFWDRPASFDEAPITLRGRE